MSFRSFRFQFFGQRFEPAQKIVNLFGIFQNEISRFNSSKFLWIFKKLGVDSKQVIFAPKFPRKKLSIEQKYFTPESVFHLAGKTIQPRWYRNCGGPQNFHIIAQTVGCRYVALFGRFYGTFTLKRFHVGRYFEG